MQPNHVDLPALPLDSLPPFDLTVYRCGGRDAERTKSLALTIQSVAES